MRALHRASSIRQYLTAGQIEQVICGGENYDGARPCNFDWVKSLRQECVDANVTFCFIETGTVFIKDGKRYHLPSKQLQSRMAYKSGMNFREVPSVLTSWTTGATPSRRKISMCPISAQTARPAAAS